jgi:hypothetical protein
MSTPGFTAEASLGKTRERYILSSKTSAETGKVLLQMQCEPGVCVCRGGESSADCVEMKGICDQWIGCDRLGRCYCAVYAI